MTEAIKDFFLDVFGEFAWLGILLIAMIPVIELRGAIPFALGEAWAGALSPIESYVYSVIGATIPALIIIPLLIPFFNFLKRTKTFKRIVEAFETKFVTKSKKIEEDINPEEKKAKKELKKFIGVMTFVAIPLPLTGAWTGSAVAAYLKMSYPKAVLAVLFGNIIAGAIMTCLCVLLPQSAVDLVLYAFVALAVVVILSTIIVTLVKAKKSKKLEEEKK